MIKYFAFIFSLVYLFSLGGCSNDNDNKKDDQSLTKPNASQNSVSLETTGAEFSEITVVDGEECLIKITDITNSGSLSYTLSVYLENFSDDKTYMFSLDSISINGLQIESYFATEVAAGKRSNEKIMISDSSLDLSEIEEVTDIELTFRVYDSDDLLAEDIANETVNIYPKGKEKAVKYVRRDKASDVVIAENEHIKAVLIDYEDDDIWGYTVNLYLVNKTDSEVMFAVDDVSVNGMMVDPFYADSVKPQQSTFSSISWSENSLVEAGIEDFDDINDIEFTMRAYDYNNIIDEDFFGETIKLTP